MTKDDDKYKLQLSGSGLSFDQPISGSIAHQIITLVMGGGNSEVPASSQTHVGNFGPTDASSPKAFMASKRATTDMEKVTCLAYYLAHHRNTAAFKTKELTDLNIEASQPKLSNPSATARNAVTQGLLALAGSGRKQITTRGEGLVNALPDREKAKSALAQHPIRKPRKRTRVRKAKR
jgi:hypothetical protein